MTPASEQTSTAIMRRWRNRFANVPVLSLLLFRWWVLYGSEVIDWALTERTATRRAHAFTGGNVKRWNAVQVARCRPSMPWSNGRSEP